MQPVEIRGENDGNLEDGVHVDQRARHRFTDPINIDRRCSNEGDDKDNSRGQERWNHDDAKPSNVKAVVGRCNSGTNSSVNG